MAAALSSNQFLDVVRKSRLVDEQRLQSFLQSTKLPARSRDLAQQLVRGGLLTPFQVGQLLHGRWRGFLLAQGKYKLLDRLGAGGMGQVFLCEHVRMRRLVALKVLPTGKLEEDRTALERFDREARAAAALDHPNIVGAHDIDTDGKLHFLVMEYVDGMSLQEFVRKHGPLDVVRACHYIADAARGLQHAHEAGWVHRDVKPGNLLLGRDGTVKLLDLGLARLFTDSSDKLTGRHKKEILGTADYVAPEQATNSSDVDVRADIYSLGATFYFLLTGCSPFAEGTVTQKLIWHQTKQPEPVRSLRSDVPKELEALVNKMMAKKPVNRYQEPAAVEAALEPWTRQPIAPPADEEMPRLCPALLNYSGSGASLPRSGISGPPSTLRNHGPRTATSRKAIPPPAAVARRMNRWVTVGIAAVIVLAIAVPVLMSIFGMELPVVLKFNTPPEPVRIHATPQPKDNVPPPPPKELPVPPKE